MWISFKDEQPKDGQTVATAENEREMSGGIEPVKIKQIPQPDWVVIEVKIPVTGGIITE